MNEPKLPEGFSEWLAQINEESNDSARFMPRLPPEQEPVMRVTPTLRDRKPCDESVRVAPVARVLPTLGCGDRRPRSEIAAVPVSCVLPKMG